MVQMFINETWEKIGEVLYMVIWSSILHEILF